MNDKYIGITDNRIKHMLSVARKCYTLAKEKYEMSEEDARKYFMMGLIHDIGYEFIEDRQEHPFVGADILESMTVNDWCNITDAIRHHGKCTQYEYTDADYILNEADLTVDSKGKNVSIEDRLEDIKVRYGEKSRQYKDADEMCKRLSPQDN
jgi:predicted hydrolase (HD superfamily)